MADHSFWYLENIDVVHIFCPRKMSKAHDDLRHVQYRRSEYIYLQDDTADTLFLIIEGKVKIGSYTEDGKEVAKAILAPGEVFGELALMQEGKRRDFAYAMEPTTVCELSSTEMRQLMRDHSGLNLFFLRLLGSRLLEMENRLQSLVFKDARSRIIEFLLELVKKRAERIGQEYVIPNAMSHKDIASLTATSRQTVTSVISELRKMNILTFDRRQLLVRDIDLLSAQLSSNE